MLRGRQLSRRMRLFKALLSACSPLVKVEQRSCNRQSALRLYVSKRVPACCTGQCNRYICCVSLILFQLTLISPWLRPRFALSTSTPFCLFLHGGKAGKVSLNKLGESPLPWTPRSWNWSLSETFTVWSSSKKCILTSPTFRRLYWIQFTLTIQSTNFYGNFTFVFCSRIFFSF